MPECFLRKPRLCALLVQPSQSIQYRISSVGCNQSLVPVIIFTQSDFELLCHNQSSLVFERVDEFSTVLQKVYRLWKSKIERLLITYTESPQGHFEGLSFLLTLEGSSLVRLHISTFYFYTLEHYPKRFLELQRSTVIRLNLFGVGLQQLFQMLIKITFFVSYKLLRLRNLLDQRETSTHWKSLTFAMMRWQKSIRNLEGQLDILLIISDSQLCFLTSIKNGW